MDIFTAVLLFGGVYIAGMVLVALGAAWWGFPNLSGPALSLFLAGLAGLVSVRYLARRR